MGKIPPAAGELLPVQLTSDFDQWYKLFEEYTNEGTWKVEQSMGVYQKNLDRHEKMMWDNSNIIDRHDYQRQFEIRYEVATREAKLNNLKQSPDEIAIRLSWLEWYKTLSYEQMQAEIKRIEKRKGLDHFDKVCAGFTGMIMVILILSAMMGVI